MKDRYPGLRAFDKDQSSVFFGREKEVEDLYNLVCLEKVVLLFGKSGLGKSSLLNAGLTPLLEEKNFFPIRIRFDSVESFIDEKNLEKLSPLKLFLKEISLYSSKSDIIFDAGAPRLWEEIKSRTFFNPRTTKDSPVCPIFIFDQFEEFFYYPQTQQEAFLSQLSEVVHQQPPNRILEWITQIDADTRTKEQIAWHKQPDLKIIIAIRSDKLAFIQSVAPYIPTIMRNRFELRPLNSEQANKAISQPALIQLNEEYVQPFTYDNSLLEEMVAELRNKTVDEIESSQLQIVCNYIEEIVRKLEKQHNSFPIVISKEVIDPEKDIPYILDNFYERQIGLIPDKQDRLLAKEVIEDLMVADGSRASLLDVQLLKSLHEKKELIEILLKARLIREENTSRGLTYEVSHDTLVASIEKSRARRQDATKKSTRRKYIALAIAINFFLAALVIWFFREDAENKRQIARIFEFESEKQLANGNRLLARILQDQAQQTSKDEAPAANPISDLMFIPFAGTNIEVSADTKYVATNYLNNQLLVWRVDTTDIKAVLNLQNIRKFNFAGDSSIWGIDTAGRPQFYLLGDNVKQQKIGSTTDSLSDVKYLYKTRLLVLLNYRLKSFRLHSLSINQNSLPALNHCADSLIRQNVTKMGPGSFPANFQAGAESGRLLIDEVSSNKLIMALKNKIYLIDFPEGKATEVSHSAISNTIVFNNAYDGMAFEDSLSRMLKIKRFDNSASSTTPVKLGKKAKILGFTKDNRYILFSYHIQDKDEDNILYYQVYQYDTLTQKDTLLLKVAGKPVLSNDRILYINNNHDLCSYNLTRNTIFIIARQVYSFQPSNIGYFRAPEYSRILTLPKPRVFDSKTLKEQQMNFPGLNGYGPSDVYGAAFYKMSNKQTGQSVLFYQNTLYNNYGNLFIDYKNAIDTESAKIGLRYVKPYRKTK